MTMCESTCTINLTMTSDLDREPCDYRVECICAAVQTCDDGSTTGAVDMQNVTQTATRVGLPVFYKLATTSSTP